MAQPTLQDITGLEYTKLGFFQQLRQSIEALRHAHEESEQRRREIAGILDGITDIMMVLTHDLRIVSVNHVFEEITGIAQPEGEYCHRIFRHKDAPCPGCPALLALQTGKMCRDTGIFQIQQRNLHFDMVASPIASPADTAPRILMFKRDMTREKELQSQYLQAEKMATVGVLAAGVAHEINNPLTSIAGFAEGVRRRVGQQELALDVRAEMEEDLDTILTECRRCQDIVRALLTFSRPQFSCVSVLSLSQMVRDVLKISHSLVSHPRYKHIHLVLQLAPDDEVPLLGDEGHLKQVILNLLSNALYATAHAGIHKALRGVNPSIELRTYTTAEGCVCLSVRDNGCGIPEENMHKIFEPFFTTKHSGLGIGVGLSTCYSIVRAHNGEIRVESVPNEETCFTVCLPAISDSPQQWTPLVPRRAEETDA